MKICIRWFKKMGYLHCSFIVAITLVVVKNSSFQVTRHCCYFDQEESANFQTIKASFLGFNVLQLHFTMPAGLVKGKRDSIKVFTIIIVYCHLIGLMLPIDFTLIVIALTSKLSFVLLESQYCSTRFELKVLFQLVAPFLYSFAMLPLPNSTQPMLTIIYQLLPNFRKQVKEQLINLIFMDVDFRFKEELAQGFLLGFWHCVG